MAMRFERIDGTPMRSSDAVYVALEFTQRFRESFQGEDVLGGTVVTDGHYLTVRTEETTFKQTAVISFMRELGYKPIWHR